MFVTAVVAHRPSLRFCEGPAGPTRAARAAVAAIAGTIALMPSPAAAQASGAISIFSDDRFRGYSLSDGYPVGIFDLSYDAPSGLYGAVSGSMAATHSG